MSEKPLIEIAGQTIIDRIVQLVIKKSSIKLKKIGFIIEKPDVDTENTLVKISKKNKIPYKVFYQGDPQGTAHAIYCAKELLRGPTLIVFADTLFETNLDFCQDSDGSIFVQEVANPSSYGVVKTNSEGIITEFIEKPNRNISNLAIVGIYYFNRGERLTESIKYILDNNIIIKGEYQITTALENLKNKNFIFKPHKISNWFDFGTPTNLLQSHAKILKKTQPQKRKFPNTTIIEPCYIGPNVHIENSIIGPAVSIAQGTVIEDSKIKNSIIQSHSYISGAEFKCSIIGSHVHYKKDFEELHIGDYSIFK